MANTSAADIQFTLFGDEHGDVYGFERIVPAALASAFDRNNRRARLAIDRKKGIEKNIVSSWKLVQEGKLSNEVLKETIRVLHREIGKIESFRSFWASEAEKEALGTYREEIESSMQAIAIKNRECIK